MYCFTGW